MTETNPQIADKSSLEGHKSHFRKWQIMAAVAILSIALFVWNSCRLKRDERPYVGEWTHALVSGEIPPVSIVVHADHTLTLTMPQGTKVEGHWRASENRFEFIESVTPIQTGQRIVNGLISGTPRRQTGREVYRTEWTPEGNVYLYALHPDSKTDFDKSPRVIWTRAKPDAP
ncbi:MAG: hypothetical protein R3C18_22345 [Planctomycetaceae bacterium]